MEKKEADILINKFKAVKLLHSYMRLIDYINWLTTPYRNKQLFFNLLQYYNSICPNLSCLDIFMIKWWTNNQCCNLALAWRFWATKVCVRASKIPKLCLFGCPTDRATSWKANFKNHSRNSLIKVSILINLIQHKQHFFSFQTHVTAVCAFLSKTRHIILESHVSSSV